MPQLLIFRDDELLSRIALQETTRIGRTQDNEVSIPDKRVSRSQCVIEKRDGLWYIRDRSGRGTVVGKRTLVSTAAKIHEGDALKLGAFVGVFDLGGLGHEDAEHTELEQRRKTQLLEPKPSARKARLRLGAQRGERAVALQPFDGFRLTVGTDPDDSGQLLKLDDGYASTNHFLITCRHSRWVLRDLDSRNGTWVDGVQVIEAVLNQKVTIRVGETTLVFEQDLTPTKNEAHEPLPGLVTRDPSMAPVVEFTRRVASSTLPVLIHGESGTGKEVIARALHALSLRSRRAFVALNCGALPKETIESELFGHEKGAFTGADRLRIGAFEEADGGTLFLDEIGDLPLDAQVKLLRTLESGEVRRMGSNRVQSVDVRVISASHKDLGAMVEAGTFREDLYYRLCVAPLELPPLRQRVADIVLLAEHFVSKFHPKSDVTFSPTARSRLERHPWPGNARELRNVVQLALLQRRDHVITDDDLAFRAPPRRQPRDLLNLVGLTLEDIEREAYRMALQRHGHNKKAAIEELGVARSTFFRKVDEFGLSGKSE